MSLTLFLFFNNSTKLHPKISTETEDCISCHETVTPGIVADWRTSLHSKNSFDKAFQKPEIERRVSSKDVNEKLKNVVVGCYRMPQFKW